MCSPSRVGKGLRVLLLVLLIGGSVAPALAIDFNAYWLYRASGGDDVDTRRSFEQRYSLGAGPAVTYQPTHAISVSGNVTYSREERRQSEGRSTTTETITPSGNIAVTNDIFRAGLFGTATQQRVSGGTELNSRAWDASLSSGWDRRLWPNLRLYYRERVEFSDDRATDTEESGYGFGADWDVEVAKLFYNYDTSRLDDLAAESISEQESHFGRVETGGNFWDRRVNAQLSQQLQHTKSEFTVSVDEGEVFERRLEGGETLSAVVDPVAVPDPETVEPSSNLALGDGDLDVPAESVDFQQQGHLGIRFGLAEQVDRLHLYLDPFGPPLSPGNAASLQWDLYTRTVAGEEWTLVAENVPAVFNDAESRFEFELGRRERELKVVFTNPLAGVTLAFTEIEAIELLTESQTSTRITHLTNASLRVRLTETLTAMSTLSLERSGDDWAGSDSSRRTVTGSLRWVPIPAVAPSVSFSETRQEDEGAPVALNRTYSLIVATFPLPTLNVSVGATRTDRYTGSHKDQTTDRYSLTSTALLYPDLTAGFSASYTIADRFATETTTASTSNTFNSRLTLNARLNPKLTADLTGNYRKSESSIGDDSSSFDTTTSLTYRPSGLLSVRGSHIRNWTDDTRPDTWAVNTNLALLRAEKTRVNLRHAYTRTDETVNRFGADAAWDISRNLTLDTRGDYTMASADRWNVQASLSLRI